MLWAEVETLTPLLEYNATTKLLLWNTALQSLMDDPEWVNLIWDPSARALGVQPSFANRGLAVAKEPQNNEYTINSEAMLTAAGIGTAENVTAEPPQIWRDSDEVEFPPGLVGCAPIYYLILP